jgi:hypothetical protein
MIDLSRRTGFCAFETDKGIYQLCLEEEVTKKSIANE